MGMRSGIPMVPAAFFGMVLGLAGLGSAWRLAHQAWQLPRFIGETILLAAAIVWGALLILYVLKWFLARDVAREELNHPVQCCFVGLIGVATMLVAGAANPYSRDLALVLFCAGCIFTIGFAVWRSGSLWFGERDHSHTTAVLYLPTVAGNFVAGTVSSALGLADWGQFAFGAGLFSWFAIESVLLHRLLVEPSLAAPLRPTLGIQLAPPAVGAVSLLSVAPHVPSMPVQALLGYALLQGLVLLRLLPWLFEEAFSPSHWGFTFGVTSLATAPLMLVVRGQTGAISSLAPFLFICANIVVMTIALRTLLLAARGGLFSQSSLTRPEAASSRALR